MILVMLMLVSMFGADLFARLAYLHISHHFFAAIVAYTARGLSWLFAIVFLSLFFAVIYYFAPDLKISHWHWLTPGASLGILDWLLASVALRVYVHFFNDYSVVYGGLGAVIILLTWYHLTGLMLLLGAEINSEIEAVAAAKRLLKLKQGNLTPTDATFGSTSTA